MEQYIHTLISVDSEFIPDSAQVADFFVELAHNSSSFQFLVSVFFRASLLQSRRKIAVGDQSVDWRESLSA